jgi:hypothetical protein
MNPNELDKISAVQAKYADELMQKANVVGVGVGLRQENGAYTQTPALVVMVRQKVPLAALSEEDRIPKELDGVLVDVVETGPFFAN